ncbi:hypothetical protein GGF46_000756 [Coemansia sp. RSA 552]|nr:hypothetical protein GGF46_000756 [Coemansia sp. RSA 552]
MSTRGLDADSYGGSSMSRILCKCNDFRSQPAAVLVVMTVAVFADTVVYGLIVPFLPDILQGRLGMSSSANGILFGCYGVGVLVGAPVSAYISDRWNIRKWPMIIGLIGLGITSGLFALSNAFWELVLARLAQGISSGITWSVGLGMISDVYAGEAMGQAMGIAFSGFTLGHLGGPVMGGAIYSAGGIHAIAIFVAAIAAVDLVFRLLLVETTGVSNDPALRSSSTASLELDQSEKLLVTADVAGSPRLSQNNMASAEVVSSAPELAASPTVVGMCKSTIEASPSGLESPQSPTAVHTLSRMAGTDGFGDDIVSIASAVSAPALGASAVSVQMSISDRTNAELPKDAERRRTTMLDLLKEGPILACCLATITITGASGSFEPVLPIHMREEYNLNSVVIGVMFVAIVIPAMVVSPISGKYTNNNRVLAMIAPYGRFGIMIIGSVLEAVAIAFLGATTNVAGLAVNLVAIGLLNGFVYVSIPSAMGEHVARMGGDAYAKVYALYNIAYSVGVIIIPTVLPPIMNSVGFAATMGVVSATLVFGAIVLAIHPTIMLMKNGRSAYIGENALPFL